jgi:hypothetical protein
MLKIAAFQCIASLSERTALVLLLSGHTVMLRRMLPVGVQG